MQGFPSAIFQRKRRFVEDKAHGNNSCRQNYILSRFNVIIKPQKKGDSNQMPVISRFYGMVIKMYFIASEHNPPHIHVIYGECKGFILHPSEFLHLSHKQDLSSAIGVGSPNVTI